MPRTCKRPLQIPATLFLVGLLPTAVGCKQEAAAPTGPQRVENRALGFALSDLATGCSVVRNLDLDLELACELDGEPGTVTFELGPEERGVNLLELAKAQKDWYLSQPAGEFLGNRELVTPIGAAYTARGLYSEAGTAVEEARALTLHPDKRHAVTVRYRYTPRDRPHTQNRMDQLLYLVGEISALPDDSGSDPTESADAAPPTTS